jgi:hypothetical protein
MSKWMLTAAIIGAGLRMIPMHLPNDFGCRDGCPKVIGMKNFTASRERFDLHTDDRRAS